MKTKHFAIILLLLIPLNWAICQDFAPVGAEWHYTERYAFFWNKETYVYIRSIGDTVIKGKNCRILENNGGLACTFHNEKDYVYSEDSITYFYVPEIDSFQILYDLRAQKDSSWIVVYYVNIGPWMDTLSVTVDSVTSVTINGKVLKKFHVHYEPLSGWWVRVGSGVIIEGIGDRQYLFPFYSSWAICDGNYSAGLRCYQDTVIGLYSTGIADSCTYSYDNTGIEDNGSEPVINTYPNPTTDILFIQTDIQSSIELRLANTSGGIVIEDKIYGEHQLDLSGLPAGVYFLEFFETHKRHSFRRIIKM